ncbi:MAG: phage portal protein [Sphingomonadales bacterium]|nr:phage portal protein [Sphingomonadales bacterium]
MKKSAVSKLANSDARSAWLSLGQPSWTGRTYEQLSKEGYRKNVIANRSIRIVAESAASIPFVLYRGDERLKHHAVLDVLNSPNPLQSGKALLESFYAYLQISGNTYMEVVETALGEVSELYSLRPDRMTIIPGSTGWPSRYEYKVGDKKHHFQVDDISGKSPILHVKTFHPQDDYYGLSPLEAAAYGIDIHNASQGWNKALLDNAARPSGALVFEPREGESGTLSDEQFSRLKDELENQYQGAKNAGRPFLLEGGLKWQQISMTPQDMEFISSKHVSAREIALAFGVPPMLLGIPGDNTYANYAEANRALWRLTLLPLLEKTIASLNTWLLPRFENDLRLDFDRDAIPSLQFERAALWQRLSDAPFLTLNEKREALGYSPIEGGNKL